MMEDIKKYQQAEKLKKLREESQIIPWYYDGLENLCDRLHPQKQILRVIDIKPLSWDTKLYRFISINPKKPLAPFRAGQYIGLIVNINGVITSRPYSLVSSPNQFAYYELGIKKKDGGFVSHFLFDQLKKGDIIEATRPLGEFYHNPVFHGKDLVFIAGGCGITPFMSILRDIAERNLPLNIWLVFGCLTEKDILFREEIEKIQKNNPNVKLKFILSKPEPKWKGACGFITKNEILSFIGSVKNKFFYIVGSRDMYQFIEQELNSLEIPRHRILYEAFGVPNDIKKVLGWPREIDGSKKIQITVDYVDQGKRLQKTFEASCVEPLLNTIERQRFLGNIIETGCRSGKCGLCRTKLLSGNVFIPTEVIIREVDKDYGFIHPCISYPMNDIHLDLTRL